MSVKPLSAAVLPQDQVKQDRKKCRKFDQCGVGELAVYVPSKTMPRAYYIPFESLERVYKRVAVSPGSGKAFLTPVLYVVFQYDGGKEEQVYYKYLKEADALFDDLEKTHPSLPLISEKNEQKKRESEEEEERIRTKELSRPVQNQVRILESARELLGMRPALYKELAGTAAFKRKIDNIKPMYQMIVLCVMIAGAVCAVIGGVVYRTVNSSVGIMLLLIGAAAMFLMVNSKILPTPKKNRKHAQQLYDEALQAMKISLRKTQDFPLPPRYAHPYVCDRMIRIIRTERAETVDQALEVLKADLKAADSSVQLSGDEYKQVVTIKPLFLVQNYE